MKTILLLLTVLCGHAAAKIGATKKECAEIYGEALKPELDSTLAEYLKGGIQIRCKFRDDLCVAVRYALIKPSWVIFDKMAGDTRFTTDQETRLLNLNRGDFHWNKEEKVSYEREQDGIYRSSDGKLHSSINFTGVTIEQVSVFSDAKTDLKNESIDGVIQGFGAKAVAEPKPIIASLPPTVEEVENQALQQSLEKQTKLLNEMKNDLEKMEKAEESSDKHVDE